MENYILRHFIIGKEFKVNKENDMFSVKNVYEFFEAPKYPAYINFKAVLGACFLNPNKKYNFEIKVFQKDKYLGFWKFDDITVDKPNEVMNIFFGSNGKFYIPEEGFVRFEFRINEKVFSTQYVQARIKKEE